ncbi:PH domain-containing protein [Bacillus suaedaesalsae]|uniref:PH domain-containing protein n=1 Tax=Bacillus suaedaesalsae TaxID=2810349 RepID=A0ABS2DGV3_9BACI|nr:PH domain-containing protein [Bacillus suaedaesalsae]MBM6617704.1 PH domain-containing protein [Bacillus suaedaesalsae]
MNKPKRLHPVAAVLRFLRSLKELAFPLVIFFFVGGRGEDKVFDLIYVVGAFILVFGMLIFGIITWLRFTYVVDEGELRIEQGVFVRNKRFIPLEKIQTIDVTSGVIQRLFGLVKIQVETAGGGTEAEVVLSAITKDEAETLKGLLKNEWKIEEVESEYSRDFKLSHKELLVMATTSGGVGVVFAGIFAFVSQFDGLLPLDALYNYAEKLISSSITLVGLFILLVVAVSWGVSIVSTALKYGKFTLSQRGKDLFLSRGLLEKRELTIPLKRIQAVRIQENMIRQWLGYSTIYVEVAGGGNEEKGEFSTILVPIIKTNIVHDFMKQFTPEFVLEEKVVPVPVRARKKYIIKPVLPALLITIILIYFLGAWGLLGSFLIILGAIVGYGMYREAGFLVKEKQIKLRYRFINRQTVFAKRNRVQALRYEQSYFQKVESLASIIIWTQSKLMGKHFSVVDVEESKAAELYKWYSYHD